MTSKLPGTVLITGGSGFLAVRCIAQALAAGYRVHATVRSLDREQQVRSDLVAAGVTAGDDLRFFQADLADDEGWTQAAVGCRYVLHVASPFPPARPENEDELIVPAREGTLRVLRAARDAGAVRAVVTSSFAAIGYGHAPTSRAFTEEDWTDTEGGIDPYIKSKALAERAAWEFIDREGNGLELAVVNPTGIFGPALGPDYTGSLSLIASLFSGAMPGTPRLYFAVVDVRDAADLHLRAMTSPAAAGQRFIAASGDVVSLHDIALAVRDRLGDAARAVPTAELPDAAVRAAAETNPALQGMVPNLGVMRHVSSDKARRVLSWSPRPFEETVAETAESLIALGVIKMPEQQ